MFTSLIVFLLAGQAKDESLPEEVLKGWRGPGVVVGWMAARSDIGWPEFKSLRFRSDLPKKGTVPAFRFVTTNFNAEKATKAAAPGKPFGVDLTDRPPSVADLKVLAGFKSLAFLVVVRAKITDEGVEQLAGHEGLTHLVLITAR